MASFSSGSGAARAQAAFADRFCGDGGERLRADPYVAAPAIGCVRGCGHGAVVGAAANGAAVRPLLLFHPFGIHILPGCQRL